MAYARPFGQAQGASPWTSGVPPGLQQQQQQGHAQPHIQPMFNQPMGAFDISGAWQGPPQQQAAAAQQWVQPPMQQVQFVPNPTFMPQQQQQHHHNNQHQSRMQQQQRPMHQRSLSAPRNGVNGQKRPMNMNNNNDFGGQQQRWRQQNNQPQQQQQQRSTRQQSRMNNTQKGLGNNNNNNNNNNNSTNNNKQQQKQAQPQQQQGQKQQQQSAKQSSRKVTVKVTKVKKQAALKAKIANKTNATGNQKVADRAAEANDAPAAGDTEATPKAQSKTAERKQLKLQARKTAEALKEAKLPVVKASAQSSGSDQKIDELIDQAQLKCVPAVFGFVCKLCDVFLRDKVARREHIDSDEHLEKFKVYEEEERQKKATGAAEAQVEAEATEATSADSAGESGKSEGQSEPKPDQDEEAGEQEDKAE